MALTIGAENKSRPVRARGLKHEQSSADSQEQLSRPVRARGLKLHISGIIPCCSGRRAPCGRVD